MFKYFRSDYGNALVSAPCDLLVLAAFPPELAPLRGVLGEGLRRQFGGQDVAAETVGIGLATAAAGAARRLVAYMPRGVVLVGTCGSYDPSLSIGCVALARRVVLAEPAVARGEAAYPEPMSTEVLADTALGAEIGAHGGVVADIATTLAVTTSDALAAQLASFTSCRVEHLEAYGVAAACAAQGVPFMAALGVANGVGDRGREEWRQNHRAASAAAIALLVAWMGAGAKGLAAR
jgi:nucleoside phosphorylase